MTGLNLIIGGTGKTGRRVVDRLNALQLPVRVGTRSGQPAFDWNDHTTWSAALDDVSAVYVTYHPDVVIPGAVDTVQAFINLAVEHGVQRLVLLSGRGEDEAQRAEAVAQTANVESTIVRASWFSQNFSENFFLEPILEGDVVLPAGDIPEPFIDAEDIADVVVAALTEDGHAGQLYEVSGPRLLTFAEAIAEISAATSREIRYSQIGSDEYMVALRDAGLPDDFVWLINYLFTTVLDGRNAHLTDGVQRALGRPPRDFADYARATATTGVWDASPVLASR